MIHISYNIRYLKEGIDNNLPLMRLKCPCCVNYMDKPDTQAGLVALLQHTKRSHNEMYANVKNNIYQNKEDEELIKSQKRQEKRDALSNAKYKGKVVVERCCEFGIGYDWESKTVQLCGSKALLPEQDELDKLTKKSSMKTLISAQNIQLSFEIDYLAAWGFKDFINHGK